MPSHLLEQSFMVLRHIDIPAGAYMVRVLSPWLENLKKRQVKEPKINIRDTGICHSLLQIPSHEALAGHPELGASWERFDTDFSS